MKLSTRIAIGLIFCCAAALAVVLLRPANLSDSGQIQNQLDSAVQGANGHSIGSIMAIVSNDYHDGRGLNATLMRQLLSDAYRNSPTVSVSTTPAVIDVQGANATSDCTLTIRQQSDRAEPTYMHSLHMSWKKEQSYSLLLFPTTVWRVVNADYGPIVELDGDENFP